MFRCIDCGKTYNTKPDFCTCGGNSFEAIGSTEKVQQVARFKPMAVQPKQIISIVIFVMCLILSLVPWLIKIKDHPTSQSKPQITQKTTIIPDIDSFWDNKPQDIASQKPQSQTKNQPKNQPKNLQSVQKKTVTPAKRVEKSTVPKKQIASSSQKEVEKTTIPAEKNTTKPKESAAQKQTITPTLVEIPKESQKQKVDPKVMFEYKKNLNIALASYMNFLDIQGNGKCAIQFNIDANGKLINRGFVYKSDNISVNNEVYKMLMRMPMFTTPPVGYNGETFKISFEMNNGNYKFSYIE